MVNIGNDVTAIIKANAERARLEWTQLPREERNRKLRDALTAPRQERGNLPPPEPRPKPASNVNRGVPSIYRSAEPARGLLDAMGQYRKERGSLPLVVCLHGPPGTGKTHNLYGLMRRWRQMREAGRAAPVFHKVIRECSMAGKERRWNRDWLEDAAKRRDWLAIDDIGYWYSDTRRVMPDQWLQEAIYYLLDTRINAKRHTIITTNLDQKTAEIAYSAQVASRMFSGLASSNRDSSDRRAR